MEALEKKKEEKKYGDKKEKFEAWLQDKYNLGLLGIILLSIVFRLYYFFITKNQAHWWDTLAYGGLAKQMISGMWSYSEFLSHEAIIRPPLLPFVWSLLLRINIPDVGTIFLLEIIPSVLSVFFIFLIAKELYNKKVALISSFILSILWIHLFYSMRIMTDVPALFFCIMSFYFFVKSYKDFNLTFFSIAIFSIALSILLRYNYGIIGALYILIILVHHKHRFVSKKNFWIGGIIGFIPIILFFVYNLIIFSSIFPAGGVYSASAENQASFAFYTIDHIGYILSPSISNTPYIKFSPISFNPLSVGLIINSLFIFFIIGFFIALVELVIGFDSLNKINKLKSHFLLLLILIASLIFFIFIIKAAEDRYLFLCLIPIIILCSIGLVWVYELIKKHNKIVATVIIIFILITALYSQTIFGNALIKSKVSSYAEMKEAFLWIKDNTQENAVILGEGTDPYAIFYSERNIANWNLTNLEDSFSKADYIVLHGFEHQTQETLNFINNNSDRIIPERIIPFQNTNNQIAVGIYRVKK